MRGACDILLGQECQTLESSIRSNLVSRSVPSSILGYGMGNGQRSKCLKNGIVLLLIWFRRFECQMEEDPRNHHSIPRLSALVGI